MNTEHGDFIIKLSEQIKNHEDWLIFVKFGLAQLLKDQDVLIEILMNEAQKELKKINITHFTLADIINKLMNELKIKIVECCD